MGRQGDVSVGKEGVGSLPAGLTCQPQTAGRGSDLHLRWRAGGPSWLCVSWTGSGGIGLGSTREGAVGLVQDYCRSGWGCCLAGPRGEAGCIGHLLDF